MNVSSTPFWKYHGLGNDFVLIDRRNVSEADVAPAITRAVCDRHTGIGADGIIILREDPSGDPFMRVLNADGSQADMCGNGLRCFVRWLVEELGYPAEPLTVQTDAGPQDCIPQMSRDRVEQVSVNLGSATMRGLANIHVGNRAYEGIDLFLGNPHYVLLRAPEPEEVAIQGPLISTHAHFPRGTNVEWLEVLDAQTARVVVYERGAGLTRACGTGGGGAATVGVQKGLLSPDVDLRIHQPGGELVYRVSSDATSVWMTGPAKLVFRGTLADGLDEA